MPKRGVSGRAGGLDIFDDENVLGAFADATAASTEPSRAPEPPVPEARNVVEMPQTETAPPKEREPETTERARSAPKRRRQKTPVVAQPEAESFPEAVAPEPNVGLKFRVPRSIKDDFSRFKAELGAALGVHLEDSNIGRAIIERFLVHDGERILVAAKEHYGEMKRPRNNDAVAMAEFDEWLGGLFLDARKRRKVTPRDEG